jgi:hypothetical protein
VADVIHSLRFNQRFICLLTENGNVSLIHIDRKSLSERGDIIFMATSDQKSAKDRYSGNNVAHTDTWGYLFDWEEVDRNFKDARDLAIKRFAFFNNAQSPEGRKADALLLAAKLDRAFRKESAATYEDGWNRGKAVNDITETLADGEKLLCELAVQMDDIFKLPIEK